MPEVELTKEILTSFAGTLLALLSAGIVWFIKSAYEKHRSEVLALAKFERIFANNLTILKDNFDFLDNWCLSPITTCFCKMGSASHPFIDREGDDIIIAIMKIVGKE